MKIGFCTNCIMLKGQTNLIFFLFYFLFIVNNNNNIGLFFVNWIPKETRLPLIHVFLLFVFFFRRVYFFFFFSFLFFLKKKRNWLVLSSVFVYNTTGLIEENSLRHLSFVTSLAEHIRPAAEEHASVAFPNLLW